MVDSYIRIHGLIPCPWTNVGENLPVAVGDALIKGISSRRTSKHAFPLPGRTIFAGQSRVELRREYIYVFFVFKRVLIQGASLQLYERANLYDN